MRTLKGETGRRLKGAYLCKSGEFSFPGSFSVSFSGSRKAHGSCDSEKPECAAGRAHELNNLLRQKTLNLF